MKITLLVLFAIAASIVISNSSASTTEWHMINVNNSRQGDAHLLTDAGINTLIDAGSPEQGASHLVPYLQAHSISTIHHLFVSHPHTDHYGGIDALVDAGIIIKNVYYNLPPEGSDDFDYKQQEFLTTIDRCLSQGAVTRDISKGFTFNLTNSKFKVLHAQKDNQINGQPIDLNDYSLIVQWDSGNYRTLFTGDLNANLGSELAELKHMKADILKVPHHGVTGIAPNSFFDTVDPQLAMFPSPRVLWDHPRGVQAKTWVTSNNIQYCHNGLNGNVVLEFGTHITATSEKPSQNCPNGRLEATPGEKINEKNTFNVTPIVSILLE